MSLKSKLREVFEYDDEPPHEAADIDKGWHADLIRAWRSEASVADCYEAFMNPTDAKAETLLEQISATLPYSIGKNANGFNDVAELQRLVTEYWWRQITWFVEEAIYELHQEIRSDRQSRKDAIDEQRAEALADNFREWAGQYVSDGEAA